MKSFLFSIIDMMIYWTIPFGIVLFFKIVTLNAFAYDTVISSAPFVIVTGFYSVIIFICYAACDSGDFDIIKRN